MFNKLTYKKCNYFIILAVTYAIYIYLCVILLVD